MADNAPVDSGPIEPNGLERFAIALPPETPCSVCGGPSRAHLVAWALREHYARGGLSYDALLANGDHPVVLCEEHATMALRAIEDLFEPIARAAGRTR